MPKTRSTTARAIIVLRRLCPTQDLICKQVLTFLVSLQTISYTRFVLVLFYSTEVLTILRQLMFLFIFISCTEHVVLLGTNFVWAKPVICFVIFILQYTAQVCKTSNLLCLRLYCVFLHTELLNHSLLLQFFVCKNRSVYVNLFLYISTLFIVFSAVLNCCIRAVL